MNEARGAAASILVLLLALLPADSLSQEVLDSLEGQRVRLTLRGPPLNATQAGILLRVGSDSLALRTPDGSAATFPKMQILRVEVSNGGNRRRGAFQGLGIGAVVGLVGFKVWADQHYVDDEFNVLGAVVIGMPVGGIIGALVGASLSRERWLPVHLDMATGPDFRIGLRFALLR